MMRRLVCVATLVTARGVPATATPSCFFSSSFSTGGDSYKPRHSFNSRSGAHRHPKKAPRIQDRFTVVATAEEDDLAVEESTFPEEPSAPAPRRSTKNHYTDLFKPKREPLSFKSTFTETEMGSPPPPRAERAASEVAYQQHQHYSRPRRDAGGLRAAEDDEDDITSDDVTRIYSTQEVRRLIKNSPAGSSQQADSNDIDVLKALEGDDDEVDKREEDAHSTSVHQTLEANDGGEGEVEAQEDEESHEIPDGDDAFASIRKHPFFTDLLRRVEKSMIRYRKEVRSTGRYSVDAVNDCIRPLLQLTDYPFTTTQIAQLSPAISAPVLKSSLNSRALCKRLHLYRSQDTDLVLDWSVEDFLRRRHESIHISWEPMDIVYRRYGWTPEIISDRDCLLYFSEFSDFVELAELEVSPGGKPTAAIITDPVSRAERSPIPASRLLIRRKATVDAEPSLTESIRLMGTPALHTPAKGKKNHHRHHHGATAESVTEMFADIEKAAEEVDGDEDTKIAHGMDSVRSLRQATHPSGRMIREISLGRPAHNEAQGQAEGTAGSSERRNSGAANSSYTYVNDGDLPEEYDRAVYDALLGAYHKTKVEVSLLRRRLLSTDSVDQASELQENLSKARKDLSRLNDQIARMRQLKRSHDTDLQRRRHEDGDEEDPRPFSAGLPNYPVAPEHPEDYQKNVSAAQDSVIDDDEIDVALNEYRKELQTPPLEAQYTVAKSASWKAVRTADGDDVEAEEEVEVEKSPRQRHASRAGRTAATEPGIERQRAALSERERLMQQRDELSWAATQARAQLEGVRAEKERVNADLDKRVVEIQEKLAALEDRLNAVMEEEADLQAQEENAAREEAERRAREEAEQKARAVEEQLRIQRERRQTELARQREEARLAQLEAERALAKQKAAEEAALAKERELERQLREVRAQLKAVHRGVSMAVPEPEESGSSAMVEDTLEEEETVEPLMKRRTERECDDGDETVKSVSAAVSSSRAPQSESQAAAPSGNSTFFMCTPEQYDGLHLAASRLRKEVTTLEQQMEEECNEDDETLMSVLAASRADLEELDECITSVQHNAPWAASADARREKEMTQSANVAETGTQYIQEQIDHQRFTISLLEKRLHHTSKRSVLNKLEQGIVQARREISRLRIEQDRLRKSGCDAFGIPASISIAETLAEEVRDTEARQAAEEVRAAARGDKSTSHDVAAAGERAEVEEEEDIAAEAAARGSWVNSLDDDDDEYGADDVKASQSVSDAATVSSATTSRGAPAAAVAEEVRAAEMVPQDDPEAHRLRLRLEGLLQDIQHLQDNIMHQERAIDYDDEETETVLLEMKHKLGQLLRLRDDVQKRMRTETAGAGVAEVVSAPHSAPALSHQRRDNLEAMPSETRRRPPVHVSSAPKKMRVAARQARRMR